MRSPKEEGESNFWISYADLMAGLLFVFILLIGAIVSKSMILKGALDEKENRLESMHENLSEHSSLLVQKERELAQKEAELQEKIGELKVSHHLLSLKEDEVAKLNRLLIKLNTHQDRLNHKVVIVQNVLTQTQEALHKSHQRLAQRTARLKDSEGKVVVLSHQLKDANETLHFKDMKLLKLMNAIDEQATAYDELIATLQSQKAKIKSLTGIKLKVIAELKAQLGNKIALDKRSGSLVLASNILFSKGSAVLKRSAKRALREAFEKYVGILVKSPRIRPHLEQIMIEGHTDSDGGYLYNLELSQRRAFAVMHYLLGLKFTLKEHIKPLLMATGRAYLDPIRVNGKEDKEASRRIEIKFRLRNEEAMEEIERILDAK